MNNAAFQTRIQRYGWDKAEQFYDTYWNKQLRRAQQRMVELAKLSKGESVLEIACGNGLVTFSALNLIGEKGKLIGTDISEKMIESVSKESEKRGYKNSSFLRMDADCLDFQENSFDVVICALGFMYFNYPRKVLSDIYRFLKPGGRTISLIWGERANCGWSGIFPVIDKRVNSEVCPLFFQLGAKNNFSFLHTETNFRSVNTERINYNLFYPDEKSVLGAAFSGGPVALAYSKFDEKTKNEAHLEYLELIEKYKNGKGYNLPGEFVIVSGVK